MKKKEIRTNGIWGAKIWFTKGRFVFFFHLVSQRMVRIFLTNYTVKWVKTDETPDLFLYWLSHCKQRIPMPMLNNLGIRARLLYIFPCIRTEREKLVPNGRASLFNESTVVWCGVYCYRQRYSSSQWSNCCGPRGAADWHCRFYFLPRYRRQIRRFFQCVTIAWHVDASSVACVLMNTANWPIRLWYYCKL